MREILGANRKDWAERRDEFAFAPVFKDGKIEQAGLVLIEQRRAIGPGAVVTDPAEGPETGSRPATASSSIRAPTTRKRSPGGSGRWAFCAPTSISSKSRKTPGDDYRDVIAGSHWLKSAVRPAAGDAVGQALFIAMQARSFRKEAIRASRTAWWQALAAAHLARREGISGEEACRRLQLGWQSLSAWIEKALSFQPRRRRPYPAQALEPPAAPARTPRPSDAAAQPTGEDDQPTAKQLGLMEKLFAEQPLLKQMIPADWNRTRKEASRWITKAIAASDRLKDAEIRHKAEIAEILLFGGQGLIWD